MHVLLVHQAFAALGEAGGTRHHEMARHLARSGHHVTVLAGGVSYLTGRADKDRPADWTDDVGVRIRKPPAYGGWHRSFFHRVLSFFSFTVSSFFVGLRIDTVDAVWGTSPPLFQVVSAWLVARLKGVPFVFEVRDLWPLFAVEIGVLRNGALIALSRWLESFLYRRADRIIVNSPGFENHVRERGGRRLTVIPNGVELSMFDPDADGRRFRQEHDLGSGFVVLYAGAHGLSNDLGVLLEAAALAPEATFVLLGDGKEKASLRRVAQGMELQNVRFLPPIPKREMREALAAADACVAILKPLEAYKTTFPNKVFDYMAAGRPVILAIDGVIREVVERAQAGLFVPPGDPRALAEAVEAMRQHPVQAKLLGANGREHAAERFDRSQQARRLEALLAELAGEGPEVDTP